MLFCFDDFALDPDRLELSRAGVPVRIDALVARLLAVLVRDAGQLVTKTELIAQVWDGRAVSDYVLTVAMVRLRRTLGHQAGAREYVVNLHGRGYRFVRPVTRRESLTEDAIAQTSLDGPFVGRASLLERLRAALTATRAGNGAACLLVGEAGIGKTRAAEVLAAETGAARVTVAWGHCQEAGDTPPFWPVAQLVRELLPAVDATLTREVQALFADPARPADERAQSLPKHRLVQAVLTVFAEAARTRPLVLVLDDLHRADAASLELLGALLDRLARLRVLVIATMRRQSPQSPDYRRELSYVVGHRNCARLLLAPLDAAAVAQYVAAQLPAAPAALAEAVWRKSEGNPFFMVELSRQLAPDADASQLDVPEAALELVRPRLRALDAGARGVLSLAAVIGRAFELDVLAAISGHDPRALMALLDEAIASEVLLGAPDAVTSFAFGHELLRQALYAQLSSTTRRATHLALAELHAARRERGIAVPAAVIAYHYHAALPDSPVDAVVQACRVAAQEASDVFAYADAMRSLRHAREALQLGDPVSPLGMELLLLQAIYARICASPDFARLSQELLTLGREQRAGILLVHAGMLRDLHPGFPALSEARATLELALTLLPAEGEPRVAARARLATLAPIAFDAALSEQRVDEVLREGERLGTTLARYTSCAAALHAREGPVDPDAAVAAEQAHEQLCREHPLALTAPTVLLALHRAVRAFQAGRLVEVEASLAHAEQRCDELGSRELSWHTARYRALLAHQTGHARRAAPQLCALHQRARAEHIVATELFCVHDEVLVLGATVARSTLERVLASAPEDPPAIWSLKLRTLAAAGVKSAARTSLRTLPLDALARLPADRDYLGTLGQLARSALLLEERELAAALYPLLARHPEHFALTTAFRCEGPVAQLLGELATMVRDRRTATRHFEAARALAARCGLAALLEQDSVEPVNVEG